MATAREFFNVGDLNGAIDALTRSVKERPDDLQQRTFLFELLCFSGDYVRAEKQLDVLAQDSPNAELGAQVYRNNLSAERERRGLFNAGVYPHFIVEPPAYLDLHLAAINRIREGNFAEARALLDRAEEERPARPGLIDGQPFEDFRDYNDLVAPALELIVQGKYAWLPFEQIHRIEIDPPKRLRDLMWATARVEATDEAVGAIGEVFLPTLYAGSNEHASDLVKLGRMTDWHELSDDVAAAVGLRVFLVDGEDKPIFEARTIEFIDSRKTHGSMIDFSKGSEGYDSAK